MRKSRALGSQLTIHVGLWYVLDAVLWVAALVRGDQWIGVGARLVCAGLVATTVAIAALVLAAAPVSVYRPVFRGLRRAQACPWAGGYVMLVAALLLVVLGYCFSAAFWNDASDLVANPLPGCDASHRTCDYEGVTRLTLTMMAFEAIVLLDIAMLLGCAALAAWRNEARRLRLIKLRARQGAQAGRA